jgi:hypothetical protein
MENGGIAPAFFTSALDRGEWPASRRGRHTPGEVAPVLTGKEDIWASELVLTLFNREENFALTGDRTSVFQPVARPVKNELLPSRTPRDLKAYPSSPTKCYATETYVCLTDTPTKMC